MLRSTICCRCLLLWSGYRSAKNAKKYDLLSLTVVSKYDLLPLFMISDWSPGAKKYYFVAGICGFGVVPPVLKGTI